MIDFRLTGRRAFVTGCASGIGLATAERLARSGAHVAMNDLPGDRLELAVGRLRQEGLSVEAMPGDLGVSASARLVAQQAVTLLGGLDYLVNNAGAPLTRSPIARSDLVALTDDFWDRILRVNLMSVFWMIQALAPQLRAAGGAVVNTVSVAAFGGGGGSTAYATAKAGWWVSPKSWLGGLPRKCASTASPPRLSIRPGNVLSATSMRPRQCHWRVSANLPTTRKSSCTSAPERPT